MGWTSGWCKDNGITFMLTSMVRSEKRNKELNSVSLTHTQGRAFDMSISNTWGWTLELITDFVRDIEREFGEYGAISHSDGKRRVIVIHDSGHGRHAHIQISP